MDDLNNPSLAAAAAQVDAAAASPAAPAAGAPASPVVVEGITPEQITAAMPDAVLMAGMAAEVIEKKYGIGLRDETREQAAKKLAPLLVKYDVESPWLRRWRYEIEALMFVGATAYAIWRAKKQADEAEAGKVGGDGKGE